MDIIKEIKSGKGGHLSSFSACNVLLLNKSNHPIVREYYKVDENVYNKVKEEFEKLFLGEFDKSDLDKIKKVCLLNGSSITLKRLKDYLSVYNIKLTKDPSEADLVLNNDNNYQYKSRGGYPEKFDTFIRVVGVNLIDKTSYQKGWDDDPKDLDNVYVYCSKYSMPYYCSNLVFKDVDYSKHHIAETHYQIEKSQFNIIQECIKRNVKVVDFEMFVKSFTYSKLSDDETFDTIMNSAEHSWELAKEMLLTCEFDDIVRTVLIHQVVYNKLNSDRRTKSNKEIMKRLKATINEFMKEHYNRAYDLYDEVSASSLFHKFREHDLLTKEFFIYNNMMKQVYNYIKQIVNDSDFLEEESDDHNYSITINLKEEFKKFI